MIDGGDSGESMSARRGWITPFMWGVMERMGYDLINVGKRDFADTAQVFLQQFASPETKYLTGNIADSSNNYVGDSYNIFEHNGSKVGVVSTISENYSGYFRENLLAPSVATILKAQAEFRKQNVDFSILIFSGREREVIDLMATLDGFDVIFIGNSNGRPMQAKVDGMKIPIIGPGDRGREIAMVTLKKSDGETQASVTAEIVPLDDNVADSPKYEPVQKEFAELSIKFRKQRSAVRPGN